jgi:hypothetical protein
MSEKTIEEIEEEVVEAFEPKVELDKTMLALTLRGLISKEYLLRRCFPVQQLPDDLLK